MQWLQLINGFAVTAIPCFNSWRSTLVPISTFVTSRELAITLQHADVQLLVIQPRLRSHDHLESLRTLPVLPELREIIALGDATTPYPTSTAFLRRTPVTPPPAAIDSEGIACLLYTSGTTGDPKGVMLSHRAILATVVPTSQRCGLTAADSLLSTLPLFWVAGLVIRALPTLASGCTLIFLETFTLESALAALRTHRPSALHLRPPQVGQLLAHPDFTPDLLGNVRRGGGRVEWYAPHLDASTTRLITGYGMTETAGYVTALDWRDTEDVRRAQLGASLPGVELRVVDAGGRRCAVDQVGEVCVRGPGMFSGYYKQPPNTGMDADGFFMTGDLGRIDASGTFHFIGRSKDLLRVKGINVAPVEVEAVLAAHPAVESAYVVGIPPDGSEQQVVALIIAKAGAQLTPDELHRFASTALSHYKRPAQYVFINRRDVPLSSTVKPQRAALAALAAHQLNLVGAGLKPARPASTQPVTQQSTLALPIRKQIRLPTYNYSQPGMYFLTACTFTRKHLFGEVTSGVMHLNENGRICEQCWIDLPNHYEGIELDAFVVMPNHVHGIVAIAASPTGRAGLKPAPTWRPGLPEIVRALKTFSARRINEVRHATGAPVWQRGYYEHIVRDESEVGRIREYITTNPLRWEVDRENPERRGEDEFDRWLASLAQSRAGLKPAPTK